MARLAATTLLPSRDVGLVTTKVCSGSSIDENPIFVRKIRKDSTLELRPFGLITSSLDSVCQMVARTGQPSNWLRASDAPTRVSNRSNSIASNIPSNKPVSSPALVLRSILGRTGVKVG